jgi:rubrerythrin
MASDRFFGSEICEMAIETERKGAAFYDAVAAQAKDGAVAAFATRLAEAERDHEKTFTAMLTRVKQYQPTETYSGEYLDYVAALVERDALPGKEAGERLARQAQGELEAVDFALDLEKGTIVFLHEMRKFVPEGERGVVDAVLDQERQHVVDLTATRRQILGRK